ncbi:PREDICTED: putative uncharacterized protein DDB_G0271982, partial [Priapulus caudatus]|uniref:Uncharacterized protein n=1 Tax=Priapulus caudatus TaxID=37621 RepID=A0ABM1F3E9_PRICU
REREREREKKEREQREREREKREREKEGGEGEREREKERRGERRAMNVKRRGDYFVGGGVKKHDPALLFSTSCDGVTRSGATFFNVV